MQNGQKVICPSCGFPKPVTSFQSKKRCIICVGKAENHDQRRKRRDRERGRNTEDKRAYRRP